jgi:hypothetical protein
MEDVTLLMARVGGKRVSTVRRVTAVPKMVYGMNIIKGIAAR